MSESTKFDQPVRDEITEEAEMVDQNTAEISESYKQASDTDSSNSKAAASKESDLNELILILHSKGNFNSLTRKRAHVVHLFLAGHSVTEIAKLTQVCERSVYNYIAIYNEQGIKGLTEDS
jgi:DNA-binding NarL/FixJ family response regulator